MFSRINRRMFKKEPVSESESEKTPEWVQTDINKKKKKIGTENYDVMKKNIIENNLKSPYFLKKRYGDYEKYNTREYGFYKGPEEGDTLLLEPDEAPNGLTYGMVLKRLQGEITVGTRQQICFDAVVFMLLSEKSATDDHVDVGEVLSEARKYSAFVNDIAYVNDGQQFYKIQEDVKRLPDKDVEPEISGGKKTRKHRKHRKSKKARKSHKKRNKSHRKK